MDPLHVHLALNHGPGVGALGALLLLGWGLLRRSTDVTLVALVAFVLVAALSLPVFLVGGRAAERMQALPEVTELVVRHEESSVASLIGLLATAGTAIAALFVWRTTHRYPGFAATATLILGIAAAILLLRTSNLGGQIRHSEIRAASTAR